MTSNDSTGTITLTIDGMSCGHCVAAVREALAEVPGIGVQQVAVGSATITVDPQVASPQAAVEAVRDTGYEAQVADAGSR